MIYFKCKICGDKTINELIIDMKRIAVCEFCSNAIFVHQSRYLSNQEWENLMLKRKKNDTTD